LPVSFMRSSGAEITAISVERGDKSGGIPESLADAWVAGYMKYAEKFFNVQRILAGGEFLNDVLAYDGIDLDETLESWTKEDTVSMLHTMPEADPKISEILDVLTALVRSHEESHESGSETDDDPGNPDEEGED
jgi:hypothetical protein